MKPGLQVGQISEMEITVSPPMRAEFGGQTLQNLLSTPALIHHLEWVARKTILPYLEAHEESMAMHVDVAHLMMTPIGVNLKLKARVIDIRENKIECEIEASNWRGKVAKATIVQAIVQRTWLENKIREMTLINGLVVEQQAVR